MRVLVKAPGEDPVMREVEDSLDGMQATVGGYIQFVSYNGLHEHEISLYCNDEGKYDPKCLDNVALPDWTGALPGDVLVGTFFLCGSDGEGGDVSLTEEQERVARAWLAKLPDLAEA